MSLGKTLKSNRELIPLTLRQVEEVTGISNAYLSQLENEKIKKPSANILYKLSTLYRLDLNLLLSAAGIIEKTEKKGNSNLLKNIAFYAENLTDEEEQKVMEYIKFLRHKKNVGQL
jgi:transcriptional regulator with XRE-family HTH domain